MSDKEYNELALGDNRGNVTTKQVWFDCNGWSWSVTHNGVVKLSGWDFLRRDAKNRCDAAIQRFARTGEWSR